MNQITLPATAEALKHESYGCGAVDLVVTPGASRTFVWTIWGEAHGTDVFDLGANASEDEALAAGRAAVLNALRIPLPDIDQSSRRLHGEA